MVSEISKTSPNSKSILQHATIVRETSCFPCQTRGWTGWQRPKMKGSHQNHKLFGSQTMVAAFRKMYSIVLRPASTRSGNQPGWHGPRHSQQVKIYKKNKQTDGAKGYTSTSMIFNWGSCVYILPCCFDSIRAYVYMRFMYVHKQTQMVSPSPAGHISLR